MAGKNDSDDYQFNYTISELDEPSNNIICTSLNHIEEFLISIISSGDFTECK